MAPGWEESGFSTSVVAGGVLEEPDLGSYTQQDNWRRSIARTVLS